MTVHDTQSFFTPDEFLCEQSRMLSQTYNLAHVLLNRSQSDHIFIPIRSMQYLAIIENNVFWFVDSLAYAVRGDEGGRIIRVSWHPVNNASERESLTQNMDCRVVFYGGDMHDIQNRLSVEFYKSMQLVDQRHRDTIITKSKVSILPLRMPTDTS